MCRGKELLVNAVGSHICNNVVRWLIDPSRTAGAVNRPLVPIFVIAREITETTSTSKTLQERFFDGAFFLCLGVFVMSGLENAIFPYPKKTVVLFHELWIENKIR